MIATSGVPLISLSGDRVFRNQLRRYKRKGFLATTKLNETDLTRLRQVLTDYHPQSLLSAPSEDSFFLTFDTGCTQTSTGCIDDFVPGTLIDLDVPLEMEGIAGGLLVKQKGRVRYELLTDDGEVHVLDTTAYFTPELPCRLFSPQAHFRELVASGRDPSTKATFSIKHHQEAAVTWETSKTTTLNHCEYTHLPRLHVYRDALNSAKALALKGCVTDEVDQNLTSIQKLALRFHFRLGHIGFQHVQWLGRQGILGPEGVKLGKMGVQPANLVSKAVLLRLENVSPSTILVRYQRINFLLRVSGFLLTNTRVARLDVPYIQRGPRVHQSMVEVPCFMMPHLATSLSFTNMVSLQQKLFSLLRFDLNKKLRKLVFLFERIIPTTASSTHKSS
jgi:hypothetical protein